MAIVIGTNSYTDENTLFDYAGDRGVTISGDPSALLIQAMDVIEGREGAYQGARTDSAQSLSWPRAGVYIHGYPIDDASVPQRVIDAQCAFAIDADSAPLLPTVGANQKGAVTSEKVDVIQVNYADGGKNQTPINTHANGLLKPLYKRGAGGLNVVRV